MTFSEIAKIIKEYYGKKMSQNEFGYLLFYSVTDDAMNSFLKDAKEKGTLRFYISGDRLITNISQKIIEHLNPDGLAIWLEDSFEEEKWKKLIAEISAKDKNFNGKTIDDVVNFLIEIIKDTQNKSSYLEREYQEYLQKASEKYSLVKTMLYYEIPRNIYDFFVCNDLRFYNGKEEVIYQNVTASVLFPKYHFLMFKGIGGNGKSMMLRHLFLSTVQYAEELNLLPIFLSLRKYKGGNFHDFAFEQFHIFDKRHTKKQWEKLLKKGQILFLLDGFDELEQNIRSDFIQELNEYLNQYAENYFVLSTRLFFFNETYVSLSRFITMEVQPFKLYQAAEMIQKLDFRKNEPIIKQNFLNELQETLYDTHKAFASNPLLLTIMLQTYDRFAEIPNQQYLFYQRAYMVMSKQHDAGKEGYHREFRTGLTAEQFSDIFSEFCARSYANSAFEIRENEAKNYYDSLSVPHDKNLHMTLENFMYDAVSTVCMMYREMGAYHFIHRSIQEYFSALYFSKQKDIYLWKIAQSFERRFVDSDEDNTFAMLFEMIPKKIEEYVFLPYLENLFSADFGSFLSKTYPVYRYDEEYVLTDANSFLYRFLRKWRNLDVYTDFHGCPLFPELQTEEKNIYAICAENLPKYCKEIMEVIKSLSFPPYAEYVALKEYYNTLRDFVQNHGNDFFDFS